MSAAARDEAARPVHLHPCGGAFWQVRGGFEAPVRLLASRKTAEARRVDGTLAALRPVSRLPGLVPPITALPALAHAHGVPHGVVLVTDQAAEGVVVPAAAGHDIGAGVQALALPWEAAEIRPRADALANALREALETRRMRLDDAKLDGACTGGMAWANRQGWGEPREHNACDNGGIVTGADAAMLSPVARSRGQAQFGLLAGERTHVGIFEVTARDETDTLGLSPGQAVLVITAGSRGMGYQITEEAIESMARAGIQHRIPLVQRALACVPVHTREGRDYLAAMAAAVNFAAAHRRCLAARAVEMMSGHLGPAMAPVGPVLLTDQVHHCVRIGLLRENGTPRPVLIHRKGCTALDDGPGRPRFLATGPGGRACLAIPARGAHATFYSAGTVNHARDKNALLNAGAVRIVAGLREIVRVYP